MNNNKMAYQISQEAQQNATERAACLIRLNVMGKKLAQATNSNLSESEIETSNKDRIDGENYDGWLTYAQY